MRGHRGLTLPFAVNLKVTEQTRQYLDFVYAWSGKPAGAYIRQVLEDYLDGLTVQGTPEWKAYQEWRGQQATPAGRASMRGWIADKKMSQRIGG